ncbi:alpha/beta hydrolase family protein [Kordiimonas aquimaris]|uniref:alpha/beta hydrolase family protein n=1 Tax=Kordiimonas aquimaris TaxID=707591 RepID=UPI0021D30DC8|nr:alpha/beta hydrolase [Kordiimonas aquimaris]
MKKTLFFLLVIFNSIGAYSTEYDIQDAEFFSHDSRLSGSIVFPVDQEIRAAVVFVHGSGKQLRNIDLAKRFAQDGIAALVYDKRGVGRSGGEYESRQSVSEKNITLLADDSLAALNFLHEHPKIHNLPIGLTGISQAGWIVPLAAEQTNLIDFLVLWSGPVCKVSEEDIYSKYTADLDDTEVPSYNEALSSRTAEYIWPNFLGKDSDPSDSLIKLNIPGLWVFGEQDGSVPIDLSIKRLKVLIKSGKDYEYALFSSLGHNNMRETLSMVTDWIKAQSQ